MTSRPGVFRPGVFRPGASRPGVQGHPAGHPVQGSPLLRAVAARRGATSACHSADRRRKAKVRPGRSRVVARGGLPDLRAALRRRSSPVTRCFSLPPPPGAPDFRGRGEVKVKATGRERQTLAAPGSSPGSLGIPGSLGLLDWASRRRTWPSSCFRFPQRAVSVAPFCALPPRPRVPWGSPRMSWRRVVHRGYPHCW